MGDRKAALLSGRQALRQLWIIRQRQLTTKTDTNPHPLHSTPIDRAMFLQRSAVAAARRVAPRAIAQRTFTTSFIRRRYLGDHRMICH
jgi:hypothetical protein